jgi:hypothetical protein
VSVNRPAPPISGYFAPETEEVVGTTDESPSVNFHGIVHQPAALLDFHNLICRRVDQSGAAH